MKQIYYPILSSIILILFGLTHRHQEILLAYVVVTILSGWWVYYDAKRISFVWGKRLSIKEGKSSFGAMILWPIDFPLYLVRRNKFKLSK